MADQNFLPDACQCKQLVRMDLGETGPLTSDPFTVNRVQDPHDSQPS